MQPSQNNLAQEIGLIAVSVAIVAGAVALRILGYIDNALLLEMIGVAGALWGLNGALKAPSPAQQNQLNAQNVNLQQLVQYALSVLQPQAPVTPPQGQQTAQPNTGVASGQVAHVLATPPEVTLTPALPKTGVVNMPADTGTATTPQTQFKSIVIPDVSAPYPAVGQGIQLGQ